MKNAKLFTRDIIAVFIVLVSGVTFYVLFSGNTEKNNEGIKQAELQDNNKQINMANATSAQLKIEIIKEGSGVEAQKGQTVLVDYTGYLEDGTVFDSSIPRGKPFAVTLGQNSVILGWEIGLLGMKVGEERKLTIPPELAYGESGYHGVIPPNATLIFDVKVLAIQ